MHQSKNTFDDVQFWVKAFGVVENAGALDAGTLAQNMQALSERVEQKIEENKQSTLREINNAKADINQQFLQAQENLSQIGTLKTVWQGNVGSGQITISEKCFGKTLIFIFNHQKVTALMIITILKSSVLKWVQKLKVKRWQSSLA